MPKARQRYLLAKLTSMKRLKVFLDVSESSRLILKPLQNELYQEILPNITFEDKRILLDHSILSFFIQRLENCRLSLVREPIIYVEGADQELLENYIKYSITGKPALKTAYDQGIVLKLNTKVCSSYRYIKTRCVFSVTVVSILPNELCGPNDHRITHPTLDTIRELIKVIKTNPKLILANNIKVDMKIMLESSRNFDTIIIPSNCTNDMVIPLSIHKNEINTFYKISSSHKVHKTILWNGIFIKYYNFKRFRSTLVFLKSL